MREEPGPAAEAPDADGRGFVGVPAHTAGPPPPGPGLPPLVAAAVRRPGTPLPPALRAAAEQRFGHDFGRVRLHTDGPAATAADGLGAQAFTVGPHIAFAPRRFSPSSPESARLLTHELVHVVQQELGAAGVPSGPGPEAEASALADDPGAPVTVRSGVPVGVHCAPAAEAGPKPGSGAWLASQRISMVTSDRATHWASEEERRRTIRDYLRYAGTRPELRAQYEEAVAAYPDLAGDGGAPVPAAAGAPPPPVPVPVAPAAGSAPGPRGRTAAPTPTAAPVVAAAAGTGARVPPGMSLHEVLEADTHAFYYAGAYQPQVKQQGVDLVLGNAAPTVTQGTGAGGRAEVTEEVVGGTWIQIKRLKQLDDMSPEALKARVAANVTEAAKGFEGIGAGLTSESDFRKGAGGAWTKSVLRRPDVLLIHVEVPGMFRMSPPEQGALQEAGEAALRNSFFRLRHLNLLKVPVRVVVVGAAPSRVGGALRAAGSLAKGLGPGLLRLMSSSAFRGLLLGLEAVDAYMAFEKTLTEAERAAKGGPFVLTEETEQARTVADGAARGRVEAESYSTRLNGLQAQLEQTLGEPDTARAAMFSLFSVWTRLDSARDGLTERITQLEATRTRAATRRRAAEAILTTKGLPGLRSGPIPIEVTAFQVWTDLEHVINHLDRAIADARATVATIQRDAAYAKDWVHRLRLWVSTVDAGGAPGAPGAPGAANPGGGAPAPPDRGTDR
ncbi:DUF4157 domain-containing protein [Kitasatospora sp. NBC_01560]|uniref:eCIS core domain-containing protein n=1 Tax=Kitasatospora sp. NBC_01560 TaxID=2975965 RepID=UPI003866E893